MNSINSDAQRLAGIVTKHLQDDYEQAINSWVAVRLANGGTDGALYDTREAAIRHQPNEFRYFYIKIPPDGMTVRIAVSLLKTNRQLANAGMRLADPDKEIIPPITAEDLPGATALPRLEEFIKNIQTVLPSMSKADQQWWRDEIAKARRLAR